MLALTAALLLALLAHRDNQLTLALRTGRAETETEAEAVSHLPHDGIPNEVLTIGGKDEARDGDVVKHHVALQFHADTQPAGMDKEVASVG